MGNNVTNTKSEGFKLLAIRPIKDCDSKFLKNLIEGQIYQFYSDYSFIRENENDIHSRITKIEHSPSIPIDLFSSEALKINISAIVGKNGSGKSSLIELLFGLIYLVSVEQNFIDKPDDELGKRKYEKLKSQLKVEIYYEIDSSIRRLSFNNNEEGSIYEIIEHKNVQDRRNYIIDYTLSEEAVIDFSNLFYTIAINYSIYGLNAKHLGSWINGLFHKNDAYQTPVVINPMRSNGNFDINDENYLLKSRLLSNVLSLDDKNQLLYDQVAPHKTVENLKFTVNHEKVRFIREEYPPNMNPVLWKFETIFRHFGNGNIEHGESKISNLLYKKLIQKDKKQCAEEFRSEVERYIIKKLHKIAMTYPDYRRFLTSDLPDDSLVYSTNGENPFPIFFIEGENSFENFLVEINKEKSHITFKLNQAINYLKNDILFADSTSSWSLKDQFEISPLMLGKRIKEIDKKGTQIINYIPPSLFDVEIELKDTSLRDSFTIQTMSSGEQQMIHSIQSIVYHIRNINSVFNKNPDLTDINSGRPRVTYDSINIILDEIELYYHPEFQQEYISNLLFALNQIKFDPTNNSRIKNLNFLFSTHSPFILSDLPSQNVLRLRRNDDGKSEPKTSDIQTFGANIYDLFRDSFFMENGFIGKFAKEKIEELLKELYDLKSFYSESNEEFLSHEKFLEYRNRINLIGERIIRIRLYDLLNDLPRHKSPDEIKAEELEKEAREIRRKLNLNGED